MNVPINFRDEGCFRFTALGILLFWVVFLGTPCESIPMERVGAATPSRSSCAGVQTEPQDVVEPAEPTDAMALLWESQSKSETFLVFFVLLSFFGRR